MAKGSGKNRKRRKAHADARPAAKPDAPPQPAVVTRAGILRPMIGVGLLLLMMAAAVLYWLTRPEVPVGARQASTLSFVGSQTCSGCHATEAKLWQGSHHRHAMAHATDQSVRADFSDTSFEYAGTRSRFFRKDGKFLVETDGPDGRLGTFEIKYTFGVDPLQQYLIEFPDGRIQALSIAWDTRPKDKGGQRWFHLYPDTAIVNTDPLHWTKLNQNWNFMCAECHSTDVRKNYDAARDRFATSFSEISVGCEACHGPGSRHVAWAKNTDRTSGVSNGLVVTFDERTGVTWSTEADTLKPVRSVLAPALRKEVETCGRCHARRGQLSENWTPGRSLSETHRVSLLDRRYFHADGQMRDDEETYNYVPFKQSRMFAKGVTCSDCHDPHSTTLKVPGDAICTQCHAPEKYEAVAHRHHSAVTPPLGCVSCHMPERRYMVVDRRHDHGFRVPRPDLSAATGTPNACNDCHRDSSAAWAAQQIEAWFGKVRHGSQTYGPAFHAVWSEAVDAQAQLAAIAGSGNVPGIVRASALAELPVPGLDLIRRGLSHPDPLVRLGAIDGLESVPVDQLWSLVAAQLTDPIRGVRIRAAELLASVPAALRPADDRVKFANAAAEFVAAQELNADRPEARTALGNFLARQGSDEAAELQYRAALKLDPAFVAAAINLADLYRQRQRDDDGERILRETLAGLPRDAALRHALGLALVRLKRSEAALEELRQAAMLDSGQPHYAYVYAVGLHAAGRRDEALAVLRDSLQEHPNNPELLSAAFAFSRENGNSVAALEYAERMARLRPDDQGLADFIRRLKR